MGLGVEYYRYITTRKGNSMSVWIYLAYMTVGIEGIIYFKYLNFEEYLEAIPFGKK